MASEAKKYNNYARECVRQAGHAHTPVARDKLLDLARLWMDAAVTEEEAATVTDLDPLSASRFGAAHAGFFILNQFRHLPERKAELFRVYTREGQRGCRASPSSLCSSQAGKAKAQASMQAALNPIAVCPHSSRPQSRMSSRTTERAMAAGIAHNQMFTGTTTK
jgi:hypothetical protein